MSTNAITSLSDIIRQRIQADFMALLPEDAFKAMTDKAILEFTMPRTRSDGAHLSDAEYLIYLELKKDFLERLCVAMNSPEFSQWKDVHLSVPAFVEELISKHSDALVTSLFRGIITQALQNFRYLPSS